jgi:ElaB/YqjD/DUF883 family membrane-anchored ribosome-binding protein
METSFDSTAAQARAAERGLKTDANENIAEIKSMATNEIKSLIADVEDLIARIADLNDADVVRMRTKVMNAVGAAKDSLAERSDALRRQAQRVISGADGYVRESPWAAVGLAALVGAVVGILVARRS